MISTKQLSYALAVARTLHFKKAAEQCHISQSALSTALAELEKQLGLQLFERDNKKVLITPIGEEVLRRAQDIMVQVHELEQLADTMKAPLSFPIALGMIPTIAPYLVPKIMPELARRYPDCEPSVIEEQTHVLVDMVRKGDIDTAIIALPYELEGLLSFEFWGEDFYWVTRKDGTSSNLEEISSKELAKHNLMLLKDGHCLKDHILDVCQLSEPKANSGFSTASLNTLIQMVLANMGSTLIPQMAIEQLTAQYPELRTIHLKERGPHRRIAFVVRPNYTRISSVEALQALCKSVL